MANIAFDDVWAYSVRSTHLGQPVINTVHYGIANPVPPVSTSVLGLAMVNQTASPLMQLIRACAGTDLVVVETSAQWVFRIGDVYPGNTHLTYRKGYALAGTNSGAPLPGQPSITLSTYGETAGSKGVRGGLRLAGITEENIEDGLLTTDFLSSISAEVDACFLSPWIVPDPEATEITLVPIIFSIATWKDGGVDVFAGIDQTNTRRVPGTIRRRKEFSSQGGYPV